MRTTWMGAALALIGLAGCGGGGGDDEDKRTYMACGNAEACLVMQSDVPAEMSCSAPEVASCSTDGVLGTCAQDQFALHLTLYVYAPERLAEVEQECVAQGGRWTSAD